MVFTMFMNVEMMLPSPPWRGVTVEGPSAVVDAGADSLASGAFSGVLSESISTMLHDTKGLASFGSVITRASRKVLYRRR